VHLFAVGAAIVEELDQHGARLRIARARIARIFEDFAPPLGERALGCRALLVFLAPFEALQGFEHQFGLAAQRFDNQSADRVALGGCQGFLRASLPARRRREQHERQRFGRKLHREIDISAT
jgi:hypothetical protein